VHIVCLIIPWMIRYALFTPFSDVDRIQHRIVGQNARNGRYYRENANKDQQIVVHLHLSFSTIFFFLLKHWRTSRRANTTKTKLLNFCRILSPLHSETWVKLFHLLLQESAVSQGLMVDSFTASLRCRDGESPWKIRMLLSWT